jgi:hypothetical protein
MRGACPVARRLAQIEVQGEQRRQQIVLEPLDPLANLVRHERWVEQVDEGLGRIERGGDEARADALAVRRLDAGRPAVLHHDARRLGHQGDRAAALAHRGLERARERRAAAARHLRFRRAREQRRDVVPETAHAQVDLAQAVEEQQSSLHGRMLELLQHEFERRKRADLQQAAARSAAFEQGAPFVGRQRDRPALGQQDVAQDRHELVLPAPQGIGVAPAELRERPYRPIDVRSTIRARGRRR